MTEKLPTAMDDEFDDLFTIELEDCDAYKLPEGVLYIARSDQFMSMGFIEIEPGKESSKKSRTVTGYFKQTEGQSAFRIFDKNGSVKEMILKKGDKLKIDANHDYIIKNDGEENSVVFWKFNGDVFEAFETLRKTLEKIDAKARPKSGYKELYKQHVEARKSFFDRFKK
ncbi:MAG: hypothetical protein HY831_03425 [Candidatus Aenigmarchaeota archaeon]|nr:hypothetical protein [Candidatus Aenigmarchaeota archaeon]